MLSKKFAHVLQFTPKKEQDSSNIKPDNQSRMEKIKFREYKKSLKTMQKIKEAGLEKEIDDTVVVEANYKIKKIVGYGATSTVYKAHMYENTADLKSLPGEPAQIECDEKESPRNGPDGKKNYQIVAIKKVKNIFENDVYAHRILREIRLLRILKGHKNIMKLKGIMRPNDPKNFRYLNLVSEYCTQNLMNVIRYNAD